SGATVALKEALQQVQCLLFDGYRINVAFSEAAGDLFAERVEESLQGFPRVDFIQPSRWLGALIEAQAVVVPLLSLNTASKLSLLIADTPATNLILHGLLMGKPVVMARNGTDPGSEGREKLGFNKANPVLQEAIIERLQTLEAFGFVLTDVSELRSKVSLLLTGTGKRTEKTLQAPVSLPLKPAGRVISAADIMDAHRSGTDLRICSGSLITPLARDYATQYGVSLIEE
ncbi:MAG: hypothetical protein RBS57_04330, partial [Desulforhabdus sp.]|nr:hypothetical protein [Desulforhabdus sp.]